MCSERLSYEVTRSRAPSVSWAEGTSNSRGELGWAQAQRNEAYGAIRRVAGTGVPSFQRNGTASLPRQIFVGRSSRACDVASFPPDPKMPVLSNQAAPD